MNIWVDAKSKAYLGASILQAGGKYYWNPGSGKTSIIAPVGFPGNGGRFWFVFQNSVVLNSTPSKMVGRQSSFFWGA